MFISEDVLGTGGLSEGRYSGMVSFMDTDERRGGKEASGEERRRWQG